MEIISMDDYKIARVKSEDILIKDTQSALELVMNVQFVSGYDKIIIDKNIILEDFFDLKTKLLGDAFQKFVTYKIRIAIVGDFAGYSSKSLKDYIYETNKGKQVFLVGSEQEAIDKLKNLV